MKKICLLLSIIFALSAFNCPVAFGYTDVSVKDFGVYSDGTMLGYTNDLSAGDDVYTKLYMENKTGEDMDITVATALYRNDVPDRAEIPEPIIIDNNNDINEQGIFELSGNWTSSTVAQGYYGSNALHNGNVGTNADVWAKWTPEITTDGMYHIYMMFPGLSNRTTEAPVEIYHDGKKYETTVDQTSKSPEWRLVATVYLSAGNENYVKILSAPKINSNNGYTFADAVKFEYAGEDGYTTIVDNVDSAPYFTTEGDWSSPGTHYDSGTDNEDGVTYFYGKNFIHDRAPKEIGAKSAKWTPNIIKDGVYRIYMTWSKAGNRSTDAPVEIKHRGGVSSTTVNQTRLGGIWNYLGTYNLSKGTDNYVKIMSGTNYTIADAVKFEYVGQSDPDTLNNQLKLEDVKVSKVTVKPDGGYTTVTTEKLTLPQDYFPEGYVIKSFVWKTDSCEPVVKNAMLKKEWKAQLLPSRGFTGKIYQVPNPGSYETARKEPIKELPYRMVYPKGYFTDDLTEHPDGYPLVLALHGTGSLGDDNLQQLYKSAGYTSSVYANDATQTLYPAFVIAPQSPDFKDRPDGAQTFSQNWFWPNPTGGGGWEKSVNYGSINPPWGPQEIQFILLDLIDELSEQYRIDKSRIYITGISSGGYAAWYYIWDKNPHLDRMPFAAAVPIAGAGDTSRVADIAHISTWCHQGDMDVTVSINAGRGMDKAFKELNNEVYTTEDNTTSSALPHTTWTVDINGVEHKYTEYVGIVHSTVTEATSKLDVDGNGVSDVADWLYKQKKK